jgi:hypothetical protein
MCATISPVQRLWATLAVFFAVFVILVWSAAAPGIASAYVDPVAKIQDQDEALYASISLHMEESGDWATPMFLDRFELVKPPLLYWLEAGGMKLIGPGRSAIRLPSILAGAATVALVFAWLMGEGVGSAAALAGAVLLLSSHLFFILSRIGLTDALLTLWTTLAMFALARDPALASRSALWIFGLASGAAIMTKGIAGLFPLLALGLFCVISWLPLVNARLLSRDRQGADIKNYDRQDISWKRLLQVVAISAAIAAPWHLYELWLHTRWFVAQYVMGEIVTNSLSSPTQSTQETHLAYYAKRLVFLDAPLAIAALTALALTLKRTRTRVLLAWVAVVLAAAMAFDYRNTSYVLPIFPALVLLVGGALPKRLAPWALGVATLLFVVKIAEPARTWGLPFTQEASMPSEPLLDRYAALHRGNELILGDPDDEFYSACLNLPQVRYLYIDPNHPGEPPPPSDALDFEALGVTVSASSFARPGELWPQFAQRLHDWGLPNDHAIASVIIADNVEQVEALLHSHPEADFYIPADWAAHDGGVHDLSETVDGRRLLLSREVIQRSSANP